MDGFFLEKSRYDRGLATSLAYEENHQMKAIIKEQLKSSQCLRYHELKILLVKVIKRWSEAESFTIFENHVYSTV